MAQSEERRRFEERQWNDRDDDWQRDRDRVLARPCASAEARCDNHPQCRSRYA